MQDGGSNSDNQNDMDNSVTRKLKIAMARHDAKNPKGSNHATEPDLSEYGDEKNNEGEMKISSIHNGNAWDTISKRLKIKQPRRLSF